MLQYFRERKLSLIALLLATVALLFSVSKFQPVESGTITTAEITAEQAAALYSDILITDAERELGHTLFADENIYSLFGDKTTILDFLPHETIIRETLALNDDIVISELAVIRNHVCLTLFDQDAQTRTFYYFLSANGPVQKGFAQYKDQAAVFSVENDNNALFRHIIF